MSPKARHPIHTFDIDNYLNHVIPRSPLRLLPTPVSFWFGYRAPKPKPSDGDQSPTPPRSVLLVWLFSFLGGFIGIAIIENVFRNLPMLGGEPVPLVIASFGAAAILEYNAIESPLSQPRNLVFGHFLSAVIGIGITKLFRMLPPARFEDLRWVAGALSVGIASTLMGITKTVHPPAGATALLAATTPQMTDLGWWMLPLVLLACVLMLASAMLVNNLYKRFPLYWWTPADLSRKDKGDNEVVSVKDVEQGGKKNSQGESGSEDTQREEERYDSLEKKRARNVHDQMESQITVEAHKIVVPDWMELSQFEVEFLEGLQTRLRERGDAVKVDS